MYSIVDEKTYTAIIGAFASNLTEDGIMLALADLTVACIGVSGSQGLLWVFFLGHDEAVETYSEGVQEGKRETTGKVIFNG